MGSGPKVSVITPTFNRAAYLEDTILSVLGQDYPNIEYAVIDGGSTDGSLDIIRKYEHRLAWWISEPDDGQADAIAKGFARSNGELLAYLNSDDMYLPGAIRKVVDVFQKVPDAGVVFGDIDLIDERGNMLRQVRYTRFDFATLLYEGGNLNQAGSFWTRELYDRIGGIDSTFQFALDTDFFFRAAQVSHFKHIREPLARFRLHGATKSATMWDVGLAECDKIRARYLAPGLGRRRLALARRMCQLRRFVNYLSQGDAGYAFSRGMARLFAR